MPLYKEYWYFMGSVSDKYNTGLQYKLHCVAIKDVKAFCYFLVVTCISFSQNCKKSFITLIIFYLIKSRII